ncbi:SMI1/KNR4 family protein [Dictyobacter aurantiacus]|uniref:Knr4/Smi1-like domain-containing protein n=1 Tax=Dictyobacter aurantiacus TaxID=1936993 RepID=A0A401ZS75_9CHLR|nr:SMI1/KNR4 family protein [Dictyobacter aurantiacus]GCE09644.1 hypothetical protein KDAU_69730 [Dictyobacter aurantiacus]
MPHFDELFLTQIRDHTEAKWRDSQPLTFEQFLAQDRMSCIWQKGTKWLGLSDEEINSIEKQWSLHFPPDYRLFLNILHCLDRPVIIATYDGDTRKIVPCESSFLPDWQREGDGIKNAYRQLVDDITYEVLHNNIWKPGWGRKPITRYGLKQQIEALIARAPKLIPIYGHRFLLAEPGMAGNPILTWHHSSMIIYAPDLYHFFCKDFVELLELTDQDLQAINIESRQISKKKHQEYKTIPFWGEML